MALATFPTTARALPITSTGSQKSDEIWTAQGPSNCSSGKLLNCSTSGYGDADGNVGVRMSSVPSFVVPNSNSSSSRLPKCRSGYGDGSAGIWISPAPSLVTPNSIPGRILRCNSRSRSRGCGDESVGVRTSPRAVLSQSLGSQRVGATREDSVPMEELLQCLEEASSKGREVVMAAVDKPRSIDYKGATDLVTDTDGRCELAILEVVRKYFPDHLILGEEGGVSGDPTSEYLWCIDPLDGTTNFAHSYPSFGVSIAVLYRGRPIGATVVEFAGGPFIWDTRTYTASAGGGAYCNGRQIHVSKNTEVERSLFVTGFGYEHDDAWNTNLALFKEFTDVSRGVRRLGAAAVDMCHVALGVVEAFWEYRLKPWDMAAGVLIVEEAGGKVTRMDGGDFSVFDRSVLVSNGVIHDKLVERISPPTEKLINDGFNFSQWYKPDGYASDV